MNHYTFWKRIEKLKNIVCDTQFSRFWKSIYEAQIFYVLIFNFFTFLLLFSK